MTPLGVLADDLTGSCDAGVQFSARGARVLVLTAPDAPLDDGRWDVVVLNTESRHLSPDAAARRVRDGAERLAAAGWPVGYKKIDSTLRGPLVAELAPLLAAAPDTLLVVCPAFPPAGRTVLDGVLKVQGRPVHETEFGRDRHNPVRESHLPTLLRSLGVPVSRLPARDGPSAALVQRLQALHGAGTRVLAADAATEAHLAALAEALAALPGRMAKFGTVGVGSAGLAAALAAQMLPDAAGPALPAGFPRPGPVLVVAGSRSAVTRAQVEHLRSASGTHSLALEPAAMDAPDWDDRAADWTAAQATTLAEADEGGARALLVSLTPQPEATADDPRFAARSARLNAALGALVHACATHRPLAGLVLTGGDIARAVLAALDAAALQLGPQVLPGIPLGWPVSGAFAGLPVVTKAGGFGEPDALARAAAVLHGVA